MPYGMGLCSEWLTIPCKFVARQMFRHLIRHCLHNSLFVTSIELWCPLGSGSWLAHRSDRTQRLA